MIDDTTEPALTDAERKNGWCEESLREYRRERERVTGLVGGNVVTEIPAEWKRKRPLVFEHAGRWSPLKHRLIR